MSAAGGYQRAAEGSESPYAGSEAGKVGQMDGDPSFQPRFFSPSSGSCPLCWLPPQWLCPGRRHSDWQVTLMGIWGGLLCSPRNYPLIPPSFPIAPKPTENDN